MFLYKVAFNPKAGSVPKGHIKMKTGLGQAGKALAGVSGVGALAAGAVKGKEAYDKHKQEQALKQRSDKGHARKVLFHGGGY